MPPVLYYVGNELIDVLTKNKNVDIQLESDNIVVTALPKPGSTPGFYIQDVEVIPGISYNLHIMGEVLTSVGVPFIYVGSVKDNKNYIGRTHTLAEHSVVFTPETKLVDIGVFIGGAKENDTFSVASIELSYFFDALYAGVDGEGSEITSITTVDPYINLTYDGQGDESSKGLVVNNTSTGNKPAKISLINPGLTGNAHNYISGGTSDGGGMVIYSCSTLKAEAVNGGEIILGQSGWAAPSDLRLKHNVQPVTDALEIINKLNPVTYNLNKNNNFEHGFIAQEVKEVLPELVTQSGEDQYYSLCYSRFGVIAVAAIKELVTKVNELEDDMILLKQQLTTTTNNNN